MHKDLLTLERKAAGGDPLILEELVSLVRRLGGLAQATTFFSEKPESTIRRDVYIKLGGFYAEPVEDEHLGSAFKLSNLPAGENNWNLIYGRGLLRSADVVVRPDVDSFMRLLIYPRSDADSSFLYHSSPILEGSVASAFYQSRNLPFLVRQVEQYRQAQIEKNREHIATAKIAAIGENALVYYATLTGAAGQTAFEIPPSPPEGILLTPADPTFGLGLLRTEEDNLISLFGRNYRPLLRALQHFSTRPDGIIPEMRLHINDLPHIPDAAVTLGIQDNTYVINCASSAEVSHPLTAWRDARRVS